MKRKLDDGWFVFQDVHDTVESVGVDAIQKNNTRLSNQISEWEPIPELKHLQLLFSKTPHYGWQLRQFNQAPWWYKNTFFLQERPRYAYLAFSNVDYYCKIYLNGRFVAEHEGYSDAFRIPVGDALQAGENTLLVKVWSPWDTDVEQGLDRYRTILVSRNMVKGTYEHSDGLIQRDVNPVGIYGSVELIAYDGPHFSETPSFTYVLDVKTRRAEISVDSAISGKASGLRLRFTCTSLSDGATVSSVSTDQSRFAAVAEDVSLWYTWDRGTPALYRMKLELVDQDGNLLDSHTCVTGFRTVALHRTTSETVLAVNGEKLFVRGTSYFPNQYISDLTKEKYLGDLIKIKEAGFQFIRVHVHVEQQVFYELCDELGLAVLQDSEFNWVHPFNREFTDRFISIFTRNIHQLKHHPSICLWAGLNEPGMMDLCRSTTFNGFPETEDFVAADPYLTPQDIHLETDIGVGLENCRAMHTYPGPQIYEAILAEDSSRPVIKGSFCRDDLTSGDSHNYRGSLSGEDTHYLDVYFSREKFNTEFGFDAPPSLDSLRPFPKVYRRLSGLAADLPAIQAYQYSYLKYLIEHYRLQKGDPCMGYVQFLFNDTSPVSFYGIYDFIGNPKPAYMALKQSNMPLAVMLKFGREEIEGVYAVNDSRRCYKNCSAVFRITVGDRCISNSVTFTLPPDSIVKIASLHIARQEHLRADAWLQLRADDECIAANTYADIFHQPMHPQGHPGRICHNLGCRVYGQK